MEQQPSPRHAAAGSASFRILLELDGDDPAFTNAVSLEVMSTLQQEGYPLEQPSTGQRGGGLQVLVELGVQAFTFMKEHHALISEGIQDLGGLVGIFAGVVPLCRKVVGAGHKKIPAGGSGPAQVAPVAITIEIDGHPVHVEAADLEQAEAALKLATRFAAVHPTAAQQASPAKSTVKVQGQVTRPPRQKPGRHR